MFNVLWCAQDLEWRKYNIHTYYKFEFMKRQACI